MSFIHTINVLSDRRVSPFPKMAYRQRHHEQASRELEPATRAATGQWETHASHADAVFLSES